MPRVILHQIDGSPPCRAVLMVKELLGLDMDIRIINTLAGEQHKPEFVAKNPLHSIPLIEDGDFILADSHAIITYLVSKYGAEKRADLYPNDLRTRATIDQRMYFEATMLFTRFRAIMEALLREKAPGVPEKLVQRVEQDYGYLEKYLEMSPFLAGDHVTLADIAAIATVTTMNILVPIDDKFVKIHEWIARISKFDWYQKGNLPGLGMIEGFLKTFLEQKEA